MWSSVLADAHTDFAGLAGNASTRRPTTISSWSVISDAGTRSLPREFPSIQTVLVSTPNTRPMYVVPFRVFFFSVCGSMSKARSLTPRSLHRMTGRSIFSTSVKREFNQSRLEARHLRSIPSTGRRVFSGSNLTMGGELRPVRDPTTSFRVYASHGHTSVDEHLCTDWFLNIKRIRTRMGYCSNGQFFGLLLAQPAADRS